MTGPDPIRVLVVDDHAVVRSGLSTFLKTYEDLELVAEAADGDEACMLCKRSRPHVILMDMVMPRMDGVQAIRAIRARHPDVQVIALSGFEDNDLVERALKAGAIGYLLKNVSSNELAAAIRAAHAGRPTLAPEATKALLHQATHPPETTPGHDLSPREQQVLALMVDGLNNVEIAQRLGVSRSTIKFHVSGILAKLKASNRTEAVGMSVKYHLVT